VLGNVGEQCIGVAGRVRIPAGHIGTATSSLLYDGQYTSPDTGLIYLRARVYDPATAQFMSVRFYNGVSWRWTGVSRIPLSEIPKSPVIPLPNVFGGPPDWRRGPLFPPIDPHPCIPPNFGRLHIGLGIGGGANHPRWRDLYWDQIQILGGWGGPSR
jgi:RHS repeat-associated protein